MQNLKPDIPDDDGNWTRCDVRVRRVAGDSLTPVFLNPCYRWDVFVEAFVPGCRPDSLCGFMRIRAAWKCNDAGAAGESWLSKPASDSARDAVAFKADTPLVGPELHRLFQTGRNECLRIRIRRQNLGMILQQAVQDFRMAAHGESKDGCISDSSIGMRPIMDDAEIGVRMPGEEFIQRTCDHDIQIQKQGRAGEARNFARPQRQLSPACVSFPPGNIHFGAFKAFDF